MTQQKTPHAHKPAVSAWLAEAQASPQLAHKEWITGGVALLPCGSTFDAVRLPETLVQAAVNSTDAHEVATRLQRCLDGPVIHDSRPGLYYALMRPEGTRRRWPYQEQAPRLSDGSYLGVPRLEREEPPGTHWVVPPQFEGDLCEPAAVARLITAGWRASEATTQ
ncbi:hypothetical protein SALBM135S_03616 [Streptomyces alboniger]